MAKVAYNDDFKYIIYNTSINSRKSLTRYYNKHVRENFFNEPH